MRLIRVARVPVGIPAQRPTPGALRDIALVAQDTRPEILQDRLAEPVQVGETVSRPAAVVPTNGSARTHVDLGLQLSQALRVFTVHELVEDGRIDILGHLRPT